MSIEAASGSEDAEVSWGEEDGSSRPQLQPVSYGGPANISGDAATVARIHRTDRTFSFFETVTLSVLASVMMIMSALIAIYAPQERQEIALGMAIPGWVLAFGLSGFAAFRIKLSKGSLDISGQSEPPKGRRR
jgi:hypothetical protein